MEEVIVRYFHFIGIIFLGSSLVAEHLLIEPEVAKTKFRRLVTIDAIYGASAITVLIAGILLVTWTGKPASFYLSNGLFHAKVSLFVVMGLLSIYPTVFFIKNRKTESETVMIPKVIIMIVRAELTLLLLIPLLAVFMARGIGHA